jgi:hypothetical protein
MEFTELPKYFYLFGSFKSQGKRKKEKRIEIITNFLPSKFHTVRKQQEINGQVSRMVWV